MVLLSVVAPSDGFKLYDGYYNSLFRPMAEQAISFKAKVETLGAILKRHVQQLRSTENRKVDLVFLVDSSASVGSVHFQDEIKFVRKLLADFTVDINTTRVAVVTFSSKDKVVRQVDHFSHPRHDNHKCSLLVDEIPRIKYVGGGTYTLGAFLEAERILNSARRDAQKAVILITDGFSNGGDPRPEAWKLKQRGVKVFTFGIVNGNVRELWEMASEPRNETCYILDSFEEFEALARRALHSDLHSGSYVPQSAKKCSTLCHEDGYCCHDNATCTCGTHTGKYECLCKPGFYGNGLGPDGCKPCPSGTYKNHTGSGGVSVCTPCPDENQETLPGATLVHECRCKRGFRNFNSSSEECTVFRCPELTEPQNGYFVNNQCNNVFNAACGLRCRPGYELRGSGLRICLEDGSWSGQDTECVLKTCPALPSPKNGHKVCTTDDFRYPTVCRFTCNGGFQLLGSRKRSCLAIAFWTGIAARCREITCPPLAEVRDGIVVPARCTEKEVPFGTTCQTSCLRGYKLRGPSAKQCTPDGTWSSESNDATLCLDQSPPYIQCPANIEVSANPDNDTTRVTWAVPVAVDNSGFMPVLTSDPAVVPPAQFPIGVTTVTYRAEDLSENVAKCKFLVRVIDDTPPRIDKCLPPDPAVSSGSHGNVTWDRPLFTDNSGIPVTVLASHSPGSFPQGRTAVTYTAFDGSGNNNTCAFDVLITPHSCQYPEPPVNGDRACRESEEGVHCTLNCHPGHAFVVAPPPEYFCANNNVWTPADRLPFPDCAAQYISNEVLQPASITLTGDLSCAEHKFLTRVEQNIEAKVNDKVSSLCDDNVICELQQIQTTCDDQDDFNRINVVANHRRRRAVKQGGARMSRASIRFDFTVEGTLNATESAHDTAHKYGELSRSMKRMLNALQAEAKDGQFDLYLGGRWLRFTDMDFDVSRQRNACPEGAVLINNTCVLCPVGMHYNVISHDCQSCPKGTYQPVEGQLTCLVCPEKTSTTADHARSEIECTAQCLPGSVSPSGLERCETCQRGFYQPRYAQTGCLPCPDGSTTTRRGARGEEHCRERCGAGHVSRTGLAPCYPCPYGTYQPDEAQTVCIKCPGEVDTQYRASTSITECIGLLELQSDEAGLYQNQQQLLDASECFENPCQNGGVCLPKENSLFECVCVRGYEGVFCQSPVDQCKAKPCLNGGTCSSIPGAYTCSCPTGYEGKKCEKNVNECESTPCQNGGTCVDGANSFTCNCPNGYTGVACEDDVNDCADRPCRNGGTCHDDVSGFRCSCPEGFSGTTCEIETDECLSAPCRNGGVCVDQPSDYRCDCAEGYTGQQCSAEVDECASTPCQNGAKCEDLVNAYQCHCKDDYTGTHCETELTSQYQMDFPSAGTSDYASLTIDRPLSALTIAFWMKSSDTSYGTPFSYAVGSMDNALSLLDYTGFVFYVNQEQKVTDVSANDGLWHHVVLTWSSVRGNWKIYVDGLLNDSGFDLSTARPIPGKGTLVIGQEQDSVGGNFSASEAFVGSITQFNIWDEEFSLNDIEDMRVSCQELRGNVVGWPDVQGALHGSLKPQPSAFCQGCPVPANIEFGKATYTNLTAGSKVEFSCMRGFNVGGLSSVVCLVTGEYDSAFPVCQRVDCGNPGSIPYGYLQGLKFNFDNRVRYVCNRGYKLTGPQTLYCNEQGVWEGDRPVCVEIACVLPQLTENTRYSPASPRFRPGDNVSFHCAPGHKLLTSHSTVACQSDGTWDRSVPTCDPQKCASPPEVVEGVPSPAQPEYNVGDIVRYTCETGFTLNKDGPNPAGAISCLPTGDWSTAAPECGLVNCGEPPLVAHASMEGVERTFLARVGYECQPGYVIEGSPAVECLETGSWDPEPPVCEPVDCGAPPQPDNGQIEGQLYTFNAILTFTCLSGYRLVGSMRRRCNETGQWDGSESVCNPVDCGDLTSPNNGFVNTSATTFRSQAVYGCHVGHTLQGDATRTCQEDGVWSGTEPQCQPVQCGPVTDLDHGSYTSPPAFVYEARVVYSCNQGYRLQGEAAIACGSEGSWSARGPVCVPAQCPQPADVARATVTARGLSYTNKVEYECADGFRLDGDNVRTCQADGTWSGDDPVCTSITCDPPTDFRNGRYNYKDLKIGSIVRYECNPGFRLEGEEVRRCQGNLTLSGSEPACVSVFCPTPEPPNWGRLATARHPIPVGGQVFYTCFPGYRIVGGDLTRTCLSNGTLSGSAPTCLAVECDRASEVISNGRMIGSSFTFGSIIRYVCVEGYRMEGSPARECQASGQWNATIPSCVVVECPRPSIVNGSPSTFIREFGTTVTFTCRPRHRLQGAAQRTCRADGRWDGEDPVCIRVVCPRPQPVRNGVSTLVNETLALHSCDKGFRLEGSNVSVCGESGSWNPAAPTCPLIVCPDILRRLEHGTVVFSHSVARVGSAVRFSCDPGYTLAGAPQRNCTESGAWSGEEPVCQIVQCAAPGDILNGIVGGGDFSFGAQVTYRCREGHELKGVASRRCQANGLWEGEKPRCEPVTCSEVNHSLPNGVASTVSNTFGGQVTYVCLPGFILEGVATRDCQANGQWSGEEPRCVALECEAPPPIEQGTVTGTDFRVGDIVEYTCEKGHDLVGARLLTCLLGQLWNGSAPTCERTACVPLPALPFGTEVGEGRRYGDGVLFVCNEGYDLQGTHSRKCQSDGTWDGEQPRCVPKNCSDPPLVEHATVSIANGTLFPAGVTYTCDSGYTAQGSGLSRCSADGTWSAITLVCTLVQCPKLLPAYFPNGLISGEEFSYGKVIHFSCNAGYRLAGPGSLTCLEKGRWTGEVPVCRLVTCPAVPAPVAHAGVAVEQGRNYNSTATYVCDVGYKLKGEPVTRCTEAGEWSSESRQCVPVMCEPPPDVISHGQLLSSRARQVYFYREEAEYGCDAGYALVGSAILTCGADERLHPQRPSCVKIQCAAPETPSQGEVKVSDDTLIYSCLPGFELAGVTQRRCLDTGLWEGVAPVCIPILCPPPAPLHNGRYLGVEFQLGGVVSYLCDTGFNLRGPRNRTCLASGAWSGTEPACVRVVCGEPRQVQFATILTERGIELSYNDNITYECDVGFHLVGPRERRCTSTGEWSDEDPHCQEVECGPPPDVLHAAPDSYPGKESFAYGSLIMYTCDKGHVMASTSSTYCQEDGAWSVPLPACPPVTCPQLPEVEHASMAGEDVTYSGNVSVECDEGYHLVGQSIVTCTETGQWDSVLPACQLIQCPVPAVEYGLPLLQGQDENVPPPTALLPGQTVQFKCNPGYGLDGAPSSTCLQGGTMSIPAPMCQPIPCVDPPRVSQAHTRSSTPYYFGASVTYVCDSGYEAEEGITTMTCGENGAWRGAIPVCVAVVCKVPPVIEHAGIVDTGAGSWATPAGGWLQYACQDGFRFDGQHDGRVHCQRGGAWSPALPRCVHVDCGPPPVPFFASVTAHGTTAGSAASVKCNPGYDLPDGRRLVELVCDISGTWAGADDIICRPVDCLPPPAVANSAPATFANTTFNQRVTYRCLPGYQLTGSHELLCAETGQWVALGAGDPACSPVDCRSPPTPPHTQRASVPSTTFGSRVTYRCLPGYRLLGNEAVTCSDTGVWVSAAGEEGPRCEAVQCPSPPQLANAAPLGGTSTRAGVGSRLSYRCSPGYRLRGARDIRCSESGEWLPAAEGPSGAGGAECLPVHCSPPPVVAHSVPRAAPDRPATAYGSRVLYRCLPGYEIAGDEAVQCDAGGQWVPVGGQRMPSCVPVPCRPPRTNALFPGGPRVFGMTVTLTCPEDTRPNGSLELTCMADGGWSPAPGHCDQITCPEIEVPDAGRLVNAGNTSDSWAVGEKAEFACDVGFSLVGSDVVTCQSNGLWSSAPPTCLLQRDAAAACDDRLDLAQAEVPRKVHFPGDTVVLSCRHGYRPEGNMTSRCQDDRAWTTPSGTCERVSCGPPPVDNPQNVKIFGRSYLYGDHVMYMCRPGLSPVCNPPTLTCLETGQWDNAAECTAQCKFLCQNGGRCAALNQCKCLAGYTGLQCQTPICILPCLNGGVCQAPYSCECPHGYYGSRCHKAICSRPCENGGRCLHPNQCQCFNGFKPPFCEASTSNSLRSR